jgi:uncharacterized protein involved in exopolysaccharide biosynthesis
MEKMISDNNISFDRDNKVDVVVLLRMMWSGRIAISIATALCTVLAIAYALIATPVYRAEISVIEVSQNGTNGIGALANQLGGGLAGLVGLNLGTGPRQESQAFLRSRRMVEEFVKRHSMSELYPHGKQFPTLWLAVRHFQQSVISIRDDKKIGTTILSVSFIDPNTAARWANEFVALVNELLRTRAMDESKRSIAYLNEQIAKTSAVELQRVLYNLVENETKTLMLANVKAEYAFTVVDPAVPPEVRISPQRTVIVLGGLVVGFLMGTTLLFVRNTWPTHDKSNA